MCKTAESNHRDGVSLSEGQARGPQNREWTKAIDPLKQAISQGTTARAGGLFNTSPLAQPSFPIGYNRIVTSKKQQNLRRRDRAVPRARRKLPVGK